MAKHYGLAVAARFQRHRESAQVSIDAAEAELAGVIPAPAALSRDAKRWVVNQEYQATAPTKHRSGGMKHVFKRIDVLQAEEEGDCVEAAASKARDALELSSITDKKAPSFSPLFCQANKVRAGIDAHVVCSKPGYVWLQDTLSAANIEDALALLGSEKR
jgi:hypothetical protein